MAAPGMSLVITLGASTAMLGVLLSQIMGISRMLLAMGRRNDLPHFFELIHKRTYVPHVAIVFTATVVLLITVFGSFQFVVRTATFTILLYYSIANVAALRQPQAEQIYGRIVPWLGLVGCVVMSVSLPFMVIVSGFGLLLLGFVVRFLLRVLR